MLHPELVGLLETSAPQSSLRVPLFGSVLYVPLGGLSKHGAGAGELVVRSVRKVPHVRVFLDEGELRAAGRVGQWFERTTGRELLAMTPAGVGIEFVWRENLFRIDTDAVAELHEAATAELDDARARARQQFGDAVEPLDCDPAVSSDQLRSEIAHAVNAAGDWSAMRVVLRMAASHVQAEMMATDAAGGQSVTAVPEAVVGAAREYRKQTARPGIGAWFSVSVVIGYARSGDVAAGQIHLNTNWDHEPAWSPAIPPRAYADDFQQFPRTARWIPDWLRQRLDEAQEWQ